MGVGGFDADEFGNRNVYISGPMSGRPLNNAAAFCEAHAHLKMAGVGYVYDPVMSWFGEEDDEMFDSYHYMRVSVNELSQSVQDGVRPFYDYVILLPGWEDSLGSRTEAIVAAACGVATQSLRARFNRRA